MRIESGSQNLSRTEGVYAYPARRYRNDAVESVSRTRAVPEMIRKMTMRPDSSEVSSLEKLHLYAPESLGSSARLPELFKSQYVDILA